MKRNLTCAALALLCLAGCGNSGSGGDAGAGGKTAASPAPAADGPVRIAFVTNNASDFWKIAEAGTQAAAKELGVEVQVRKPTAGTAEQQQQIVEDLITTGVSGIAISPKDPANQTEMLNETAAQVNLITQDSDAPESNRLCYIGTNNQDAGREAGKLVKQALPGGGKLIACVGTMDAQNARDRLQGLKEEIVGSGCEVIAVRTDETDRAKAMANVEDALQTNPDIAGFVGLWSYNGPAILNAVKAAGKEGAVKIIAFDEEEETLQGVADGHIFGTVVQRPYEFGYQSVKLLAQLAGGDKAGIPENKTISIPTLSVTQANVEAFREELKKQMGTP
jgi:ribose transport system substrate-binding protein